MCSDSDTYCRDLGLHQKRKIIHTVGLLQRQTAGDLPMGSLSQKATLENQNTARTYDTASIRSLSIEDQIRVRKDKVETWERIRKSGSTAEEAAEQTGIPVRTLYEWKRKPIPGSTRPHHVRTRENQKQYEEQKTEVYKLRMKFRSWGGKKLQTYMENLGHEIKVSKVCRIISELIREKKIKSYYSGTFAKPRNSQTGKALRAYAIALPEGLRSFGPGEVVQIDTLYFRVGPNRYIYIVNAICIYSKLAFSHVFEAHTAKNSAYLLKKLIRRAPFEVQAVQTDQGTEFRAAFERACQERGITFYVNNPHSPTENAFVERFNKTMRDDFLSNNKLPVGNLKALNRRLDRFIEFFNTQRPYETIDNLTPMAYFQQCSV